MPASRVVSPFAALNAFANQVKADHDLGSRIAANPEDQLKRSVPALVEALGTSLGRNVSLLSESPIEDVGRPDLAIAVDGLLVGYIELKAPGIGTTQSDFRGHAHNLRQLRRFRELPNIIYTDARDWTLYRDGKVERACNIRLGEIEHDGAEDLTEADAAKMQELFREFLKWEPIVPRNPKDLAKQLAPITKTIRTAVAEGSARKDTALASIYDDWKRTLFPDATPDEFADSYAQTVTYGLLLARLSGAVTLETREAAKAIEHHSSLLSRTLEILTQDDRTLAELGPGFELLERTIEAVDPAAIRSDGQDPWLYFYEDFLAEYDPKLRNERGVYYTPAEVVKAQVTLVDDLLRNRLGKDIGIGHKDVTVLDPATGTGTYLLQALQQGVENGVAKWGPGTAGSIATQMAENLYGFEYLVGPYAVAHLRLNQAVKEAGGREPDDGVHIYLTDTLESPNEESRLPHSFFEKPLAEERERAREVKRNTPILVCIGNPPYEREEGDPAKDNSGLDTGGWIRHGDEQTRAPLASFLEPARDAGAGKYLRNLYNSYVYFWRWALWKVFESQNGPGIVSFITASSYLRGLSFVGMREEMRRTFDELWIIDLEGEGRGARRTENVFDIMTPVAIAVGIRYGASQRSTPAAVRYARFTGSRAEKYSELDSINCLDEIDWQLASTGWHAPFMPAVLGDYYSMPAITDLLPWQHAGSKLHRSWPIGESHEVLVERWSHLLSSSARGALFRETRDRRVDRSYPDQLDDRGTLPSINSLPADEPLPPVASYGFRSFDVQHIIKDTRVGDFCRPPLWKIFSDRQLYITTLIDEPLSIGPAVSGFSCPPDMNAFNNRNGKAIPLYRDAAATEPNITHGLLGLLAGTYGETVTPEDLAGYIAGVLGHPGYTEKFHDELEVPGPRVPLTRDAALFQRAADLGRQVIAWQTYAERFPESIGTTQGVVPQGSARITKNIPTDPEGYPQDLNEVRYDEAKQELHVGEGVIGSVNPRIWDYEVSGLRVVRSWLGYRVRDRSGRKSSPLDDIRPESWTWEMTQELMRLLWVLEGVIALEPAQAALLDEIVAGELFLADELPQPTDAERKAPTFDRARQPGLF